MYTINWTTKAQESFSDLQTTAKTLFLNRKKTKKNKASRQEGLYKQVHKTIKFLSQNPKHPSLNTHEYHSLENPFSAHEKVFVAYAQNKTSAAYRIFWCYGPSKNKITILAITPHP
jgi:hypothetical protein